MNKDHRTEGFGFPPPSRNQSQDLSARMARPPSNPPVVPPQRYPKPDPGWLKVANKLKRANKKTIVIWGIVILLSICLLIVFNIIGRLSHKGNTNTAVGVTPSVQISSQTLPDCIGQNNSIQLHESNGYYQCTVALQPGEKFAIYMGSSGSTKQVMGCFKNPTDMQGFMSHNPNLVNTGDSKQAFHNSYTIIKLGCRTAPANILVVVSSPDQAIKMVVGNDAQVESNISNWANGLTDARTPGANDPTVGGDVLEVIEDNTPPNDTHFH